MKKSIFVASLAVTMAVAAAAQNVQKDGPPKPPAPPKPMVKKMKDLPPPPPPPDAPPPPPDASNVQLPQEFDQFMKRNKDVKDVHWKNDEIIIRLKSGKEERYNLNDARSKTAAEAKYGALPQAPPPPPPPPPPPKAPKKKSTLS